MTGEDVRVFLKSVACTIFIPSNAIYKAKLIYVLFDFNDHTHMGRQLVKYWYWSWKVYNNLLNWYPRP